MALAEFLKQLDELVTSATAAFDAAADEAALEAARVEFLGAKKGRMKSDAEGHGRGRHGGSPGGRQAVQRGQGADRGGFAAAQTGWRSRGQPRPTGPSTPVRSDAARPAACGWDICIPITQTIEELKDIMGRLGFSVADGPEIEDEWHNFEALNIPLEHPARDPLDNFYLSAAAGASRRRAPLLLRSQTSTVQIRVMEKTPPPVRIISLGRVYRPDTADATHYPMFHQMEGLLVDRSVTMADLKSVLRLFATSYPGQRRAHPLSPVVLPVHRAERRGGL